MGFEKISDQINAEMLLQTYQLSGADLELKKLKGTISIKN